MVQIFQWGTNFSRSFWEICFWGSIFPEKLVPGGATFRGEQICHDIPTNWCENFTFPFLLSIYVKRDNTFYRVSVNRDCILQFHILYYRLPTLLPRVRACAKGLSNRFCPSVSPVKIFEISTFTGLNNCCTRQWHGNLKKNNVCVPDRDQSSSLLCISSYFIFGIVHHFDMVNHLDTVETGHSMRTPSMCAFTSLLIPRIAKSCTGAWERDYAFI